MIHGYNEKKNLKIIVRYKKNLYIPVTANIQGLYAEILVKAAALPLKQSPLQMKELSPTC